MSEQSDLYDLRETIDVFNERFGTCHDALIYRIEQQFVRAFMSQRLSPYVMRVTIGAIDLTLSTLEKHQWINITFEFENVSEFGLLKAKDYSFAVISKLSVHLFEDEIMIDFFAKHGHLPTGPLSEDSDCHTEAFSKACVVVARQCRWSMSPHYEFELSDSQA